MLSYFLSGREEGRGRMFAWLHPLLLRAADGAGAGDARSSVVLMLQGPVGPFFGALADEIAAAGFSPLRIIFNGGDRLFAGRARRVHYRGGCEQWGAWIRALMARERPRALLLMGDTRPLHAEAIRQARGLGVPVWVFEEGYVRAGYVTLERGGVNANSPLRERLASLAVPASSPAAQAAGGRAPENARRCADELWRMVLYAALYHLAAAVARPAYPRHRRHRARSLGWEAFAWLRNPVRKALFRRHDARTMRCLAQDRAKTYFVVALQVADDQQIRAHGRGWAAEGLIETVIDSFAQAARPQDILVFKGHPFERGHFDGRRIVAARAARAGVSERVSYLDDGAAGDLVRAARGLLTINSTLGLLALRHGVPVMAFGDALYSAPGLACRYDRGASLDAFWRSPLGPDRQIADAALALIRSEALVEGSFYAPSARARTCANTLRRLGLAPAAQSGRALAGAR